MRALKAGLWTALAVGLVGVSVWWMQLWPFTPAKVKVALPARAPWATDSAVWTKQLDPAQALAADLRSESLGRRLAAIDALPRTAGVRPEVKGALLLEQLRREVTAPPKAPVLDGSYLPTTSTVKLKLAFALKRLGPEGVSAAKAVTDAGDEEKEWLLLARAFGGDAAAAEGVRAVLAGSAGDDRRVAAAHALGLLKDHGSIPALEKALADPFAPELTVHEQPIRLYPVREEAARSLSALGVKLAFKGPGEFVREAP